MSIPLSQNLRSIDLVASPRSIEPNASTATTTVESPWPEWITTRSDVARARTFVNGHGFAAGGLCTLRPSHVPDEEACDDLERRSNGGEAGACTIGETTPTLTLTQPQRATWLLSDSELSAPELRAASFVMKGQSYRCTATTRGIWSAGLEMQTLLAGAGLGEYLANFLCCSANRSLSQDALVLRATEVLGDLVGLSPLVSIACTAVARLLSHSPQSAALFTARELVNRALMSEWYDPDGEAIRRQGWIWRDTDLHFCAWRDGFMDRDDWGRCLSPKSRRGVRLAPQPEGTLASQAHLALLDELDSPHVDVAALASAICRLRNRAAFWRLQDSSSKPALSSESDELVFVDLCAGV